MVEKPQSQDPTGAGLRPPEATRSRELRARGEPGLSLPSPELCTDERETCAHLKGLFEQKLLPRGHHPVQQKEIPRRPRKDFRTEGSSHTKERAGYYGGAVIVQRTAASIRRMARPALSRGRLPGWFKMPVLGKLKLCGDLGLKTCG